MLNVLVGCEESGTVREKFRKLGHNAWSCDLLPTRIQGPHHQCDIFEAIKIQKWDMAIFHPPCKFLALCQAWRRKPSKADALEFGIDPDDVEWRLQQREKAVEFATKLWNCGIPKICIEQPKSILSTRMAPKSQTIHPWQFGHMEQKETWLWLKNLSPLKPTNIVYDEMMKLSKKERERVFYSSPGEHRSRERSKTYEGIARAMAEQWGL